MAGVRVYSKGFGEWFLVQGSFWRMMGEVEDERLERLLLVRFGVI